MISVIFHGLTSAIGVVSSSLGIGGGCLLLSLFSKFSSTFSWLETKYIAPLVTTTVLSNNLVRSIYYCRKKHKIYEKYSLIDYSVLTLMAPFDTIGSYTGILFSEMIPYKIIEYITLILFFLISVKLLYKLSRKETDEIPHISIIYKSSDTFHYQLSLYSIGLIFGLFEYVKTSIIVCLFSGCLSIRLNILKQNSPNILWTRSNSFFISIASFFIGFLSTLIGIGGSMISTPVLLNLNFSSSVIISTNSISGLFSTISSSIQYYRKDRILLDKTLVLFFVNFISCIVGTYISYYIQKKKDKFYTFFLLILVIICNILYIDKIF